MEALQAVFPMLIVVALVAVLITLLTGVVGMLRGGQFNKQYGNKLMRLRVASQGVAVLLIVVYVAFIRGA
jgi:hypothetical protein